MPPIGKRVASSRCWRAVSPRPAPFSSSCGRLPPCRGARRHDGVGLHLMGASVGDVALAQLGFTDGALVLGAAAAHLDAASALSVALAVRAAQMTWVAVGVVVGACRLSPRQGTLVSLARRASGASSGGACHAPSALSCSESSDRRRGSRDDAGLCRWHPVLLQRPSRHAGGGRRCRPLRSGRLHPGGRAIRAVAPSMPAVENAGGTVLSAPRIVPVFFPGETQAAMLTDAIGKYVVSAEWRAATAQYGVGGTTAADPVLSTDALPSSITTGDLGTWLAGHLDGTHPGWGPTDEGTLASSIFVLYPPRASPSTPRGGPFRSHGRHPLRSACLGHRGLALADDARPILAARLQPPIAYALVGACSYDGVALADRMTSTTTTSSRRPRPIRGSSRPPLMPRSTRRTPSGWS